VRTPSVAEVNEFAGQMLGATLVTVQTGNTASRSGPHIEEGSDIKREFSSRSRSTAKPQNLVRGLHRRRRQHRGRRAQHAGKILTLSVDPATGIMAHHGRTVAKALGLGGDLAKQRRDGRPALCRLQRQGHGYAEINRSSSRSRANCVCSTPKCRSTTTRCSVIPSRGARDETEEDAKEIEASKHDLNYVVLDGTIGCMVNGAGVMMATMDIIALRYGTGELPDVGGASVEKVAAAFKIITADPNVKGILVNIFGGIMKCDVIAEGVVAAVKQVGLKVPLVVRLEGTNVEAGKKIISESGLNVVSADNLDDAAQKIVKAVKGG
jgi:succinyl-CoA synthetase beta subunit